MGNLNENELTQRALAAYFRAASKSGAVEQPSTTEVLEHDGLSYVVLSSRQGVLAVYRVRIVNGSPVLKGLKRWPRELVATA